MIELKNASNQLSSPTSQKYTYKKLFILQKNFDDDVKEKKKFIFLVNKVLRFFVEKKTEKTVKKNSENPNANEGRWTKEEHIKFLEAIIKYGLNWKRVTPMINTRTSNQIRSHAQKFFKKLKEYKDEKLGIDFTKKSIKNLKDLMNYIKSLDLSYDLIPLLLYIAKKSDIQRREKAAAEYNINTIDKNNINTIAKGNMNNIDINSANKIDNNNKSINIIINNNSSNNINNNNTNINKFENKTNINKLENNTNIKKCENKTNINKVENNTNINKIESNTNINIIINSNNDVDNKINNIESNDLNINNTNSINNIINDNKFVDKEKNKNFVNQDINIPQQFNNINYNNPYSSILLMNRLAYLNNFYNIFNFYPNNIGNNQYNINDIILNNIIQNINQNYINYLHANLINNNIINLISSKK